MNRSTVLLIALLLLLLAYPLASFGTEGDTAWLVWATLGLLALGGLIPPLLRFTGQDEDENDHNQEDA